MLSLQETSTIYVKPIMHACKIDLLNRWIKKQNYKSYVELPKPLPWIGLDSMPTDLSIYFKEELRELS